MWLLFFIYIFSMILGVVKRQKMKCYFGIRLNREWNVNTICFYWYYLKYLPKTVNYGIGKYCMKGQRGKWTKRRRIISQD